MYRYAIEENKLDKLDAVNSVHELTGVVKLFFRFVNLDSRLEVIVTAWLLSGSWESHWYPGASWRWYTKSCRTNRRTRKSSITPSRSSKGFCQFPSWTNITGKLNCAKVRNISRLFLFIEKSWLHFWHILRQSWRGLSSTKWSPPTWRSSSVPHWGRDQSSLLLSI